jgi:hypothetical protein
VAGKGHRQGQPDIPKPHHDNMLILHLNPFHQPRLAAP